MQEPKLYLNTYLRKIIAEHLVEEYEIKCFKIVKMYENRNTSESLLNMLSDFNDALLELGKKSMKIHYLH